MNCGSEIGAEGLDVEAGVLDGLGVPEGLAESAELAEGVVDPDGANGFASPAPSQPATASAPMAITK